MAEYRRRRALYAAERRDRLPRAAAVAALLAGGLGLLVGLGLGLLGVSAGTAARWALALATAVVSAVRFFRPAPEVESWRADAEAERRTARSLDRLARAGYTVLHDRVMPDSAGNIDHLVLGPSGVWVVDSDAHRGLLRHDRGGLWAGRVPLRARLSLVQWMAEEITTRLLADLPEGWQMSAQPVVAFGRAELPPGLALLDGVVLLPAADVAGYVLSAGVVLTPLDVAMLVDVAERTFPPYPVQGTPPGWPARSRLRGLLGR
ncbi:MAG TPA: nuclease-related domain-containing protein [Frankiaceae bacterium]|nr:nuclease-related domain-containing protein [Frankiaceae bacterium]